MKKLPPAVFITLVGLLLLALLLSGNSTDPNGEAVLPLLARLAICELGFIICVIGAYLGGKQDWGKCSPSLNSLAALNNTILAIFFAYTGFQLWPL